MDSARTSAVDLAQSLGRYNQKKKITLHNGLLSTLFGELPKDDKWQMFYRLCYGFVQPTHLVVHQYILPKRFEGWKKDAIYRFLGVAAFGRIIPTEGIVMRRITGERMFGYTRCNELI